MFRQEDFQSDNYKNKSNQGKTKKKKRILKRKLIKIVFLRSLCKVTSALDSYYVLFFTQTPKSIGAKLILNSFIIK